MANEPVPLTGVITTPAPAAAAPGEPSLTLSQLRALLRDAAAYERATRPPAVHQHTPPPAPATTGTATADGTGHPGITVTIPAPGTLPVPAPGTLPVPAPLRHGTGGRGWWVRAVYASCAVVAAGAAGGAVTGAALVPAAVCAAGLLGALATGARAIAEQQRQSR